MPIALNRTAAHFCVQPQPIITLGSGQILRPRTHLPKPTAAGLVVSGGSNNPVAAKHVAEYHSRDPPYGQNQRCDPCGSRPQQGRRTPAVSLLTATADHSSAAAQHNVAADSKLPTADRRPGSTLPFQLCYQPTRPRLPASPAIRRAYCGPVTAGEQRRRKIIISRNQNRYNLVYHLE